MFGFFKKQKEMTILREEVQDSFNHVKKDFNKVSKWISHLDDKQGNSLNEISILKEQMLLLQEEVLELRETISFFGSSHSNPLFKQQQTTTNKQTAPLAVQTPVQTGVQTAILEDLTVMERAIVWALLNSEMKLSYEDIAALLGKDKSTIRGQINSIKQKNKDLIRESRESNGKKRLYISEEIATEVIKSIKIRIKSSKKNKNAKSES